MKSNKLPSEWSEELFSKKIDEYLLEAEEVQFASSSTPGLAKEILVVTNLRVLRINKSSGELLVGTCWISNIAFVNVQFGVLSIQPHEDKPYNYNLKDKPFSNEVMKFILDRSAEIAEKGNPEFVVGLMPWSTKQNLVTEKEFVESLPEQSQADTNNNTQNVQNLAKLGLLASFFLDQ